MSHIGTLGYRPPRPAARLKTPALKLSHVTVKPAKTSIGGFAAKITHHFSDGTHKQFVFTDPMKVGQHLTKLGRSQWRNPARNEGSAAAKQLDFG